jgi:hypothetical protein
VALLILFAAVIGGAAMIGTLAYFSSRLRRLEAGSPQDDGSRRLADQMDGMVEELLALQEEVAGLTERLDFTEKLLMSGERKSSPDQRE